MGFSKQVLLNSGKYQKEKAYWQKKLSGSFHPSRLPRDFKNTKQVKPTTEEIQFKIPDHMFKKIYQITNGSEVGVFLIVATLVNAILYRYSNDEDIVIGIPVFKQKDVGNYINDRLVIRSKLNEDITWKELLTQIQQSVKEANEHQNFPYEEVVKVITDTNFIDNSLYKLLLRFENFHHNVIHNMMEQDLIFSFQLTDIQLLSTIQYRSDLYSTETIKRFFQQFIIALEAFCENTNDKISNLDLITEEEKNQLLYEFNKKSEITDYAQTLHQLFQKSVANHSEQIAIVFNNEKISFQEINKKANQLARKLQDLGVKQRDYVGIMIDNSIEMIIGILSILKAGAAYVPIDPSYPIGRINFMLNDSDIGVLLSSSLLKQQLNKLDYSNKVVLLDSQNIYVGESTDLNLANPDAPAYVIYTSGSTGTPKGVCINHKSVVQYVNHFIHEFQLNKDDNVLLHSSFAFDASVEQLFPILLVGGRLVVPRKEELMDIAGLKKLIVAQGVSIISCTPLILNEFNKQEELKQVRTFISGGDVLRKEHISNLLTYSTVYNTYGPTEATVCATFYKVKKEDSGKILIGRPIPDKHIYIFDRKEKLVPIGIPGEIYISGRGLSKGYLNQPHLSNENFVDNPFIPGEKMYKTGDIGKWMHDGTIEYIGRIGNQVNIRGYRVELEEIEKNLLNHPAIQEAIVMIQTNTIGNEVLCAYYILNNDLSTVELKNYLREYLPEFMIPTEFIAMDKFPSTVNGKLDYNMLPKPTVVRSNQEHQVKPKNATEKLLVKIWSEVLGIKEEVIGIEDDFFKLGGHSLKATVLIANIFRELQVEIPIREFFQEPTIKNLAFYIQTVRKKEYESIKPLNKQLYYPVSASQNRLLSIAKLDESSVNYNIPGAFLIEGLLNKSRFEKAFYSLVQRHESLRTSFRYVDFEAKQVIHENVDYQIDFIYASENELSTIISRFVRAFDLESAPLFKVMLIEINENKHLFLIDIHHIISDGYSVDLMVNEFVQLYKGKELPELHIQYKDYAAWQKNFLKSEIIKKQEQYWLNQFSEEYPVLQLPTDYTRPSVKVYEGDTISVHIGKELTHNMHQIAAEKGMTLFMLLLAAYNILLSKYSDQEDIIVGVPISGRCHPDVGNIIGMFVNTLALRNRPKKDKTFLEFLDEVKKSTLNAFENQDYPFELLVEKLKVQRDTSRNPIFDTMFTFQDSSYSKFNIDGLQFSPWEIKTNSSKFDLSLYITEVEEGLHAQFEYSTELFKKDSIERLSEHFLAILEKISESSNIKLAEIEMINREEEKLLLHDFNQTQYDNHNNTLLHELFEKQVERIPDKVALQFAGRTMTYKELNEQANQLARKIRKLKSQGEEEFLVSVAMERSFEMVKTILAILKAGGAYVPIDPHHPSKRIETIIKDSQTCVLLTQDKFKEKLSFYHEKVIVVDDQKDHKEEVSNLSRVSNLENLAYVIYTSGSTGKPKGVMIEHRNVLNTLFGLQRKFPITEEDAYLLKTPFIFDVSVAELFGWMLGGGRLVILEPEMEKDPVELYKVIQKERVTHVNFVPSMLQAFVDMVPDKQLQELTDLKYIFVAGEALSPKLAKSARMLLSHTDLYNLYGPTEASIYTTGYALDNNLDMSILPIGKPLDNTGVYILSNEGKLQPIGIPGELCIAGEGVARGYLNDEKRTKEKFISHPYKKDTVLYKTGDLVRWLPDGNIEYLGRKDFQIKVRGYRIEIGEIEYCIMRREGVREVVVIDREDPHGRKYLCAYIVSDVEWSNKEWHQYMREKLPEYMIPTNFVHLENMPLSLNGKLDRKALPKEEVILNQEEYIAPRNEMEAKLVQIWSEVLGIEDNRIGVTNDFFELGGHSISILKALTKMYFHGWNISVKDFYTTPTIRSLVEKIKLVEDSAEVVHHPEIMNINSPNNRQIMPSGNIKTMDNILVTGATGFLGIHIIRELLEETDATIHCLVRGPVAEERFLNKIRLYFNDTLLENWNDIKHRIKIIAGDIKQDNLGMVKDDYIKLGNTIDTVIHAAAIVKHYGDKDEFNKINIEGTEKMIDFCSNHDIYFHYISTISISGTRTMDQYQRHFTENNLYIKQDIFDNVYLNSKFEAESRIFEAQRNGLQASIYRVGNLTGRFTDGVFQENIEENAFYRKFKFLVDFKAIPDYLLNQIIEFTPVDICSKAIVKILKTEESCGNVFHLFNHNQVKMVDIKAVLDSLGIRINVLQEDKFNTFIDTIYRNNELKDELSTIITELINVESNQYKWDVHVDSSFTRKYLQQLDNFNYPIIESIYIGKLLKHMKEVGYLKGK